MKESDGDGGGGDGDERRRNRCCVKKRGDQDWGNVLEKYERRCGERGGKVLVGFECHQPLSTTMMAGLRARIDGDDGQATLSHIHS